MYGIHLDASYSSLAGIRVVVNDARNVDRTILGIVTATGTASCAAGTAIRCAPRDGRRPEDFDITVRAAQYRVLRVVFTLAQFSCMLFLLSRVFYVHMLWPV